MKFKVTISIKFFGGAFELDEQYDRLGWEEDSRTEAFGGHHTTVEVSTEFAKRHRDLFKKRDAFDPGNHATISVALEDTHPEDWSDWGAAGMKLNYERFDEQWIENQLGVNS